MGYTVTEKLLMRASGKSNISTGELILVNLDMILGNDITSPVAISELKKSNIDTVFDKDKIALVLDHFTPNKDIKSAEQCKVCRDFANVHSLTHFYDVGKMGIEHALLPEQGIVKTGDVIIGADSHTCTYGALSAFSTGVGSTDMAMGIATGTAWLKVPSQIKINLHGRFNAYTSGKDLILHIIGLLGVDGALYKTLEFGGNVENLTMDDRFTVCNMAVECGAKNAIFPYDSVTEEYERLHLKSNRYTPFFSDDDAVYEKIIDINLNEIKPTVACPDLPSNVSTLPFKEDVFVNQVFIGSCTNGRLTDIAKAADILRGRTVKNGVRLIVIPATQKVYLECIRLGYAEDIINAGGIFSTPTCGPCLGGHMGILASHEVCLSTSNRNFVGRMGATTAKIYLANPEVAAATAVLGKISCPCALTEL